MTNKLTLCLVVASLALPGCSSRPREFAPTLAVATSDRAAFDADYETCRQLFVAGKLDKSGRLGSAAGGAAAGAGVAAGGVAAAAGSTGFLGGMAIASATVVALPIVAVATAWGTAKMKRSKKEKAIQMAMAGCLDQRGHKIVGWTRAPRKAAAAKE